MPSSSKISLLMLAALSITGCATSRIEAVSIGDGPERTSASGYRLGSEAGADAGPIPSLVETRLLTLGLVRDETASARYLVEVDYSERPLDVGAYDQKATPEAGDAWRTASVPRRWWMAGDTRVCTLSLRVAEARTGKEVYRARAAGRRHQADCLAAAPALVDSALADIPLPPRD